MTAAAASPPQASEDITQSRQGITIAPCSRSAQTAGDKGARQGKISCESKPDAEGGKQSQFEKTTTGAAEGLARGLQAKFQPVVLGLAWRRGRILSEIQGIFSIFWISRVISQNLLTIFFHHFSSCSSCAIFSLSWAIFPHPGMLKPVLYDIGSLAGVWRSVPRQCSTPRQLA